MHEYTKDRWNCNGVEKFAMTDIGQGGIIIYWHNIRR